MGEKASPRVSFRNVEVGERETTSSFSSGGEEVFFPPLDYTCPWAWGRVDRNVKSNFSKQKEATFSFFFPKDGRGVSKNGDAKNFPYQNWDKR